MRTETLSMTEPGEGMVELLATVEEVRARDFSDVDPKLVGEILAVQHQFAEDRAEAHKRTDQIINRWTASQLRLGMRP